MRKIITWLFLRYCREDEWALYKNNMGHFLMELRLAHVRDILTRVDRDTLLKAIKDNADGEISLVDIIAKMYTA